MFKYFLLAALVLPSLCLNGVTDLTDSNFNQLVKQDSSIWVVMFAAEWCGHCQHLKPQIEKVAPRLAALGVKVGLVDQKNNRKLIDDYVVDHKTHMVSYPKLKVFLGAEELADVPPGIRNGDMIYEWMKKQYGLTEQAQVQPSGEDQL